MHDAQEKQPGSHPSCISGDWLQEEYRRFCRYMEDHQMLFTNKSNVIILEPWMEVVGPFIKLSEQDGVSLAEIGKHIVVLPIELKDVLMPHLGCRISLLRTDISGKEYLFKVLPETPFVSPGNLCRDEQVSVCRGMA
jgi:hypothetical protein